MDIHHFDISDITEMFIDTTANELWDYVKKYSDLFTPPYPEQVFYYNNKYGNNQCRFFYDAENKECKFSLLFDLANGIKYSCSVATGEEPMIFTGGNDKFKKLMTFYGTKFENDCRSIAVGLLAISLYSCALLNCKNIIYTDKIKHGKPYRPGKRNFKEIHKILKITPLKEIKKTRSDATEHDEPVISFHICRGHFKTYSEEKPLFGFLSGTFYCPAHTKGSKEIGVVRKTYKISSETI